MKLFEYGDWTLFVGIKIKTTYLMGHINPEDLFNQYSAQRELHILHHLRHGNTIAKFSNSGLIKNIDARACP
jgi:hypothetical protein